MFRKNFLKSFALMGVSVLASVCANATDPKGLMDVEKAQTFTRIIEDGDPMSEETQPTTITALPNEITDHIMSFLDVSSLVNAGHVCQSWEEIATYHNSHAPLFSLLFDPTLVSKAYEVPDKEMAITLYLHVKQKGFAPLENVFISPNQYPRGTRLFNHTDLAARPDIVATWYTALFGGAAPQDADVLMLVMATLPRILVEEHTSHETLEGITSYVRKVGKRAHFTRFTGDETEEDLATLTQAPHTLVVRAHDLQAHKETLAALLNTRDDHRVVLAFDSDTFLTEGALKMSKDNIPENLHHLTLTDPFGKVTSIEDFFLVGNTNLTSFAPRLSHLTSIGRSFLAGCVNLTSFDARGLANVTSTGEYFMAGCESLMSFDARGLSGLTVIGHNFLAGCDRLPSFSAQGLSNVTTIDDGFLEECYALGSFDTTPLKYLAQVEDNFLANTGLCAQEQEKVDAFLDQG